MQSYGWSSEWEAAFKASGIEGIPGRIVARHRSGYRVVTGAGEQPARISGRIRHEALASMLPAVGDWVVLDRTRIIAVLPRRTAFERRAPGGEMTPQVVATNIDAVWVVSAGGSGMNPRRLERYVALAWASGAVPAIILTKADSTPDGATDLAVARRTAPGVDVILVSALRGDGIDELRARLHPGATVALLGPSGVGKSTLVNALAGREILATGAVRDDGKGRHTTTHRQLVPLAGGALLLDTPGLREVGLWHADAGLDAAFEDITALASTCRFGDCRHQSEPGCAVTGAVAHGNLDPERLEAWRKLEREAAWIASLADPLLARERERLGRAGAKAGRKRIREKGR